MKIKSITRFTRLLLDVVEPSSLHAKSLLSHIRKRSSGNPNHRYQITAVIVLLSGYDKALGVALCFLYMANVVDWEWLTKKKTKLPPGSIVCERGLTEKVNKLEELGLNLEYLRYLISLRNRNIHDYSVNLGYKIDWLENKMVLRAKGPCIQFSDSSLISFGKREVNNYDKWLCGTVGRLMSDHGCEQIMEDVMRKLNTLPFEPEPEYSEILNSRGNQVELIDQLNERTIGHGAKHLKAK